MNCDASDLRLVLNAWIFHGCRVLHDFRVSFVRPKHAVIRGENESARAVRSCFRFLIDRCSFDDCCSLPLARKAGNHSAEGERNRAAAPWVRTSHSPLALSSLICEYDFSFTNHVRINASSSTTNGLERQKVVAAGLQTIVIINDFTLRVVALHPATLRPLVSRFGTL